jgi:lipooligosaccharide transport system permease protein
MALRTPPVDHAGAGRAPGRLERAAIGGVVAREVAVFGRLWASTTFSSVVEPTIYLLAFGFGFGALVTEVAGYDYVEFIGTGVVATAVLFSSAFPGMFNTFVKFRYQHTYDAILAAPVDVEELVTAEALWIAVKAGVYCTAPLLVATAFGLDVTIGFALVPLVGFLTGAGFGLFGIAIAGVMPSIDSFSYVISIVLTPLFLVAGTFFPIDALPGWAATAATANPLYHCVELVRSAVFLDLSPADVGHLVVLVGFALVMWRLAVRSITRRLID